jgi:hypothetical protein
MTMPAKPDLVRPGLTDPQSLARLTLRDWDLLIRQGRNAEVLGRLHALLEERALLQDVPAAPRNHLQAARVVASSQERVIRWEVHCIERALLPVGSDFVLLKGAAYVLSEFPFSRGRIQSDIDILVPISALRACESALLQRGWIHVKFDEYDQRFYRRYSHELPPLYHPDRGTVLDVHHTILPLSGRLHPDPQKLLAAAETIPGTRHTRLCAPDMVLHASAHMFQDGDLERGLRELTDIDGLLRTFSNVPNFLARLLDRAEEMNLQRPLFYALRYTTRFLQTPIPVSVISQSRKWAPPLPVLRLMDALVRQALVPYPVSSGFGSNSARRLLYVRSHWLKMPPFKLARHLLHQSLRRH